MELKKHFLKLERRLTCFSQNQKKTKTKTKTKDDFDSYTFIYFYSIESARRMFDSFDDDADINIFPGNIDELNWDWNIASNSQILNLA